MTSFALSTIRIFTFSLELDTPGAAVWPGQSRPALLALRRQCDISFREGDVKRDGVRFPTSGGNESPCKYLPIISSAFTSAKLPSGYETGFLSRVVRAGQPW